MKVLVKIWRDSRTQYSSLEKGDQKKYIIEEISSFLKTYKFLVDIEEIDFIDTVFNADDENRDKIIVEISIDSVNFKSKRARDYIAKEILMILERRKTLYPQTKPSVFITFYSSTA